MGKPINKKLRSRIWTIVFLIIGNIFLIPVATNLYNAYTLNQEAKIVREELEKLKEENSSLESIKTKLEDDEYVATYARGEYMFSKENEKLFKLPSK